MQFYLDDKGGLVTFGHASGSVMTLKLKGPAEAQKITYLEGRDWSPERLILGANGIAALSFCDLEIEAPVTR